MEQHNEQERPVNPRRRKKSKMQIFKEAYLPAVIAGAALILIIIFIIGSITRAVQKNQAEVQASINASIAQENEEARLAAQSQQLLAEAAALANSYDYAGAINTIQRFEGELTNYPELSSALDTYTQAQDQLVAWDDPSQIVNLSFQLLIADPARAFNHEVYSYSFNRNFVTTNEFSTILQQLYDNGYILVSKDDIFTTKTAEDGSTVYVANTLYLPAGKKPLMLTQTNVNYNYYLIDSDGDKIPDANGGGFSNKLILQNNTPICEMVDANGQTVTGAYDMIPILEAFIQQHPDFSYRGAKALIALTGYNGLFGHRTHASALELFGQDAYDEACLEAAEVAAWLQENGYDLAFYTYENIAYGECGTAELQADLNNWNTEVAPILGQLDTIVFAQLSDISNEEAYSGEKYTTLYDAGFRYYIGFCNNETSWATITNDYVRQGRIMVTGATLAHHADWFTGMFDAASVLDSSRGEVPAW